jgi:hypothetical protein
MSTENIVTIEPQVIKSKRALDGYFSKWYQENKEKHLNKMKEKMQCECGCIVTRSHLARHKKSNIHNKNIENKD